MAAAILAWTDSGWEANMTSAATTTPRGAGGHRAEGRGYGLILFAAILFLPAYPFWALTTIATDVVALYGLCAYGSRQNLDAA
jgi:hypothetical protein